MLTALPLCSAHPAARSVLQADRRALGQYTGQHYPAHVNPWQRLVGTRAEPRRMANPGFVFFAVVVALGQTALGVSALTDGRTLQAVVGLGLAAFFGGWATATLRNRHRKHNP